MKNSFYIDFVDEFSDREQTNFTTFFHMVGLLLAHNIPFEIVNDYNGECYMYVRILNYRKRQLFINRFRILNNSYRLKM